MKCLGFRIVSIITLALVVVSLLSDARLGLLTNFLLVENNPSDGSDQTTSRSSNVSVWKLNLSPELAVVNRRSSADRLNNTQQNEEEKEKQGKTKDDDDKEEEEKRLGWIDTYPVDLPLPSDPGVIPDMMSSSSPPVVLRSSTPHPINTGFVVVENPQGMVSVGKYQTFHMFHLVEFYVCLYSHLHRNMSTPSSFPPPRLQWIYSHHFQTEGLRGRNDVNLEIGRVIFGPQLQFYGYEYVDHTVHLWQQEWYRDKGDPWVRRPILEAAQSNYTHLQGNYRALETDGKRKLLDAVDSILLMGRDSQPHLQMNKMWATYIDDFPAQQWHEDIKAHLNMSAPADPRLIVSYIDRQSSSRVIPYEDHDWLVSTLANHTLITFRHLHMEQLTGRQQIEIAHTSDVLLGVHGNGLTHQLWMPPGSTVVEFYFRFGFQFDYATAAQLLQHNYTAVFNGRVVPRELVARRDAGEMNRRLDYRIKRKRMGMFRPETKETVLDILKDAAARKEERLRRVDAG